MSNYMKPNTKSKGQWVLQTSLFGEQRKGVVEWVGDEYTRILIYEADEYGKMELEKDVSVPNYQLTVLPAWLFISDLHILLDASLALKDGVWFKELTDILKGVRR